jgi:hypothetical protein
VQAPWADPSMAANTKDWAEDAWTATSSSSTRPYATAYAHAPAGWTPHATASSDGTSATTQAWITEAPDAAVHSARVRSETPSSSDTVTSSQAARRMPWM